MTIEMASDIIRRVNVNSPFIRARLFYLFIVGMKLTRKQVAMFDELSSLTIADKKMYEKIPPNGWSYNKCLTTMGYIPANAKQECFETLVTLADEKIVDSLTRNLFS